MAAATTLFGADTAGLMLLAKDGILVAASAFDQQGQLAELAQEQLGHGPCMEAFTQGAAVAAHASSRLATQLQTALDSRVVIEQAKGVLMASEKVDAQTAFDRLRRQAKNTSRPLPEVAREVIDGVWDFPNHRRTGNPGRSKVSATEG